jgi:adenylylsulfate kinase-like enzyme
MRQRDAEGVLITGVYGSGKSSVAAEVAYLLQRRGEAYALLDLDFLGWGGMPGRSALEHRQLMLRNLAAVTGNYRQAGVTLFVLAYFARDHAAVQGIREALGLPMRAVRLSVPLAEISRRLASDPTTERQDDLREAAASLATAEGTGIEDTVISNDRPVPAVADQVMTWLGWQ